MLAELLPKDVRLRGLFCHNQSVTVLSGDEYRVDLLWPDGKLVVEVDGYEYHHKKEHFAADRRRDYDLFISGYGVIRFTHTEIMRDKKLVIEKMFAAVSYLRSNNPGL